MEDYKNMNLLELQQIAEQGDVLAQFQLGEHYEEKEKNVSEACKWYEKAAKQGHTESQFMLGFYYRFGDDMFPPDNEKALHWFGKAAEKGHTRAERRLGDIFRNEFNFIEACKWYKKAAEKKDKLAMYYLAGLNERKSRQNPNADVNLAVNLYEELSYSPFNYRAAMVNLALIYFDGRETVPRNPLKGRELINRCDLFDYSLNKVKIDDDINIYSLYQLGQIYCLGELNANNKPTVSDMENGIMLLDFVIQNGLKEYPPDRLEHAKMVREETQQRLHNRAIVGKWKFDVLTFEFNDDTSYSYKNSSSGVLTEGIFSVTGNVINYERGPAAGSKTEFVIQRDNLIMTPIIPNRGRTLTFTREFGREVL